MRRPVVLLGIALCACSSVVRAPPLRRASGKLPIQRSDPALAAAELAFIRQRLDEIASALGPLCDAGCRSLQVRADPELDRALALQTGHAPAESVLLYQPQEVLRMLASSESLATYGVAHEVGHYVDIAVGGSDIDDPWRMEISADAVAGCAFAALGLRLELVRAAMLALAAPEDSIDWRLDLVCGADREHPDARWELEAFEAGAELCHREVVPLERLEAEAGDLTGDSKRAAEKARAWFPPASNPCRLRRLQGSPRSRPTGR